MLIQPKVWGFICATAHPLGCELNVRDQVRVTRALGPGATGPRRVLIIGASTGYGLAARIAATFGFGAATLAVFLEKPARGNRSASAGWYNSAAFHKFAAKDGVPAWSINGDAFSAATRAAAIELIRRELGGPIDLVVYSLAAPQWRKPDGAILHAAIKPIGAAYSGKSIDTEYHRLIDVTLPAANAQEIRETVAVMGGENWAVWIDALQAAGVLAERARTVAYSYIGPEITWPIYWHGTLGRAKQDLEATAAGLRARYASRGLDARVAMLKSIVTQASAAIPVMPLYMSVVLRVMKDMGLQEGAIEQQNRLLREHLYRADGHAPDPDAQGRLRLDDRELRADVQQACQNVWPRITTANLPELSDYRGYQREFLRLFGFARDDVDYTLEVSAQMPLDCVTV